ncbi:hypothetical protein B0H11DRAFT_2161992 [Mycena galericulata]|nr:hypothetical protein B0H11DRAFT_2161992 [Mycena galericulata]
MKHISLLTGLLAFFSSARGTVFQIPPGIQNGSSIAQFTSSAVGLDAPKVSPINASSFDWWYFDVVSNEPASDLASVVIIFLTSAQSAFLTLSGVSAPDSVLSVIIWVTFPNGTLWSGTANGEQNATVTSDGDNTTGIWHGTGFSWLVTIDAPEVGVTGTITFPAVAPAHYPCGPAVAGQNMEIGPQIGWANAVPDAASVVDLSIYGVNLAFEGVGYHDKNWSPAPILTSLASWGHGRIGPYSLVWFDLLDTSGIEHVSAFLSENGVILSMSCTPGSITVRPTGPGGANATYPPVISTPDPEGYRIVLALPPVARVLEGAGEDPGTLEMDVSVRLQTFEANPEYARFIGNLSTSTGLTGVALFEQFKVTA